MIDYFAGASMETGIRMAHVIYRENDILEVFGLRKRSKTQNVAQEDDACMVKYVPFSWPFPNTSDLKLELRALFYPLIDLNKYT